MQGSMAAGDTCLFACMLTSSMRLACFGDYAQTNLSRYKFSLAVNLLLPCKSPCNFERLRPAAISNCACNLCTIITSCSCGSTILQGQSSLLHQSTSSAEYTSGHSTQAATTFGFDARLGLTWSIKPFFLGLSALNRVSVTLNLRLGMGSCVT